MFIFEINILMHLMLQVLCDCGQPYLPIGISQNDQFQITYPEGTERVFKCHEPYEMVTWGTPKGFFYPFYASKSVKIICNSGKWIGKVPRCDSVHKFPKHCI
ncbi:hypothetical protein B4U79_16671 [Dinothrombium tinctorium]|uniref:Sushi domain-containing protein n=1 Tax=Dinothrombium tinctorium TaxID=1965070 RepID=A0A3S3Q1X2_9ACAR|nr:hypothetical protein B4U79_16671 [Dinothrombium tinctorium]